MNILKQHLKASAGKLIRNKHRNQSVILTDHRQGISILKLTWLISRLAPVWGDRDTSLMAAFNIWMAEEGDASIAHEVRQNQRR